MSDLQKYIENRRVHNTEFAEGFEEGYGIFKLGILLRQAREAAGLTQEDIACQIGTPTSTVSKIENDTENVRPSLLRQYAEALGRNPQIGLA
jgi:DNA-binding XRE family transcriptional regulator